MASKGLAANSLDAILILCMLLIFLSTMHTYGWETNNFLPATKGTYTEAQQPGHWVAPELEDKPDGSFN